MKLVNIHKQIAILLFLLFGSTSIQAQVWTLQQCKDSALVHNKSVQMSTNNNYISEQKEKEAKANLIPKLALNADYKYFTDLPYQFLPLSTFNPAAPEGQFKEAQFGVQHNINANIQLAMPLYNPTIYGAIQNTKMASELTEINLLRTEEELLFEISNLFYNAQILHHQLRFIDSNLVNASLLLKNMQLLHEQLLAKATDVSKVKLQVAQLSTQKENINSKYQQILNALKFTMGMALEENLEIDPRIENQNVSSSYSNDMQHKSLEIQMLEIQNRLVNNEINTLTKTRFLPAVNLIALYGTTGFGYDKKPNDFLRFKPIGFAALQVSYPLFNGTVMQRKINQKKIELENSELKIKLVSDQKTMQIENIKQQKSVAQKTIETTSEQIELANAIYEQTVFQQKQGTANLTEILLADNALREAQQTYLQAIIDFLKADLELTKLSGQLAVKTTK